MSNKTETNEDKVVRSLTQHHYQTARQLAVSTGLEQVDIDIVLVTSNRISLDGATGIYCLNENRTTKRLFNTGKGYWAIAADPDKKQSRATAADLIRENVSAIEALAAMGVSQRAIAEKLGVNPSTFLVTVGRVPEVKAALQRGREAFKAKGEETPKADVDEASEAPPRVEALNGVTDAEVAAFDAAVDAWSDYRKVDEPDAEPVADAPESSDAAREFKETVRAYVYRGEMNKELPTPVFDAQAEDEAFRCLVNAGLIEKPDPRPKIDWTPKVSRPYDDIHCNRYDNEYWICACGRLVTVKDTYPKDSHVVDVVCAACAAGKPVISYEPNSTPEARRPDAVNHPTHYNSHPSGIECIDVVEHLPFNVGNAIKYLWRVGLKGDPIEDLGKAEFYVRREIERVKKLGGDA